MARGDGGDLRHQATYVGVESQGRRSRVQARGRVCSEPSCSTVLSIYNPSDHCGAHSHIRPRARTGRSADVTVPAD